MLPFSPTPVSFPPECVTIQCDLVDVYVAGLFVFSYISGSYCIGPFGIFEQSPN